MVQPKYLKRDEQYPDVPAEVMLPALLSLNNLDVNVCILTFLLNALMRSLRIVFFFNHQKRYFAKKRSSRLFFYKFPTGHFKMHMNKWQHNKLEIG